MHAHRQRFVMMLAAVLLATFGILRPAAAQAPVIETFETAPHTWTPQRDISGSGSIDSSSAVAAGGAASALLRTGASGGRAALYTSFSEPAAQHQWEERPGTWHWQRASVYIPPATIDVLGGDEYLTLAGMWASSDPQGYGWYLRVGAGGALSVVGSRFWDGEQIAFDVYGTFPADRWVDLEIGLHSQNGPGVKRAFAFVIDGDFYGWFRQGRMEDETYNRAAIGIISASAGAPLTVYVDDWRAATRDRFPDGPDNRPTTDLQEQDFRTQSGIMWQIDWSTWDQNLVMHPQHGLYAAGGRLQSGRNLDRMPSVAEGWGEIEIGWPSGTPPDCISSYCAAMIGFRKEINREQNLEIIPWADADGVFDLIFEGWGPDGPTIMARWRLPEAAAAPGRNMPEEGDIIRARWQQIDATRLEVRASYYDASADRWHVDIINHTFDAVDVSGVNYLDGYHDASSITIDSPHYSIRRYKVGTLDTYPDTLASDPS